ncbi:MAG: hypothetical protein Q8L98_06020, partial [Chlamydiales bacterium]|nr:hypothetical protein [Chlamydiales bacterium]
NGMVEVPPLDSQSFSSPSHSLLLSYEKPSAAKSLLNKKANMSELFSDCHPFRTFLYLVLQVV